MDQVDQLLDDFLWTLMLLDAFLLVVSLLWTERVRWIGLSVTPDRSDPPAPPINSTVHKAGSQFCAIRSTEGCNSAGIGSITGSRASFST